MSIADMALLSTILTAQCLRGAAYVQDQNPGPLAWIRTLESLYSHVPNWGPYLETQDTCKGPHTNTREPKDLPGKPAANFDGLLLTQL